MNKVEIKGAQSNSTILIGESFKNFKQYLPNKQVIVIIDNKVNSIYGQYFKDYSVIEIGQTEKIKTMDTIAFIMEQLLELKADRSAFILAVGGGIVCDIAGFTASIYLRGISFGFISTTLLSQVDASVGGKNGVNFKGFKNMLGVFNQPEFVICDAEMLKTLDTDDLNCGFGEIIKHTLITDATMFEFLENNYQKAMALDQSVIEKLVSNSIAIKAGIVNKDEKEKGERRKLNLGHTYGHAAEKILGIPHGNAVSMGTAVAAKLSFAKGMITQVELDRVLNLLSNMGLPIEIPSQKTEILNVLEMDKKREGDMIHFVLLNGIGSVIIEQISLSELKNIAI